MSEKKDKKFKTSVYFEPQIHSAMRFHGFNTKSSMNDLINQFCKEKLVELGILKEDEVIEITSGALSKINNYYQERLQDLRDILSQTPDWFKYYETEIKGSLFEIIHERDHTIIKVNDFEIQDVELAFDKSGLIKLHRKGSFEDGVPYVIDFICLYDKVIENLRKKLKKYDEALANIIES